LFRAARHLERLGHSLDVCGLQSAISRDELSKICERLVAENHRLLDPADDLGLVIFVTPGPNAAIASGRRAGPTVGLHTFPLAFDLWAASYATGMSLVLTPIEQVSPNCWPPELKCRSRMHYYLADRHAAAIERGARALLLNADGHVAETSTANIVINVPGEGLATPPRGTVLPGVSLEVVAELARGLAIPLSERPLMPADVAAADEVFLSSTPFGIVPVTRFCSRPVGSGRPGPIFAKLLGAWNDLVGLDIAGQAVRFAVRPK
jgi:branched-subunit amino acid aminotransferase/4-amino-4-deoxychorismate lyase